MCLFGSPLPSSVFGVVILFPAIGPTLLTLCRRVFVFLSPKFFLHNFLFWELLFFAFQGFIFFFENFCGIIGLYPFYLIRLSLQGLVASFLFLAVFHARRRFFVFLAPDLP